MSAPPKWPLSDPGEAYLVRHFVQKLAVWLDLCDPNRSFEYEVPERARSYPILLNAILALSARHLAETGAPEYEQCALHYNEACLKDLRNNLGCGWSEEVFAAAIILQVVAEMDCPADGEYRSIKDGHLCGIHSFVKQGNLTPGTLAAASFWVGLRQEIYRAVMVGRMVKLNLEHPLVDRSPLDEMPAKDYYAWANRAVVHCADVLNFCYSLESMEATEWNKHQKRRWLELHSWNCEWEEKKPTSFNPCHKGRGAGPFQAIWYLRSCQVIGIQHHLLAKLFLLDRGLEKGAPIPDNGYPVDERIRDIVRQICGIGLGNQWTAPSMFTACMAIAAFGEKYFSALSHHSELRAMLKILCDTQRDHGRSTKEVQTKLGNIVGWSDEGRLQNLKAEPNIPYKCEA
ncbi:hypothetical protein N656DRAFT_719711 [Canariomyces notabilis]|uniref:Uncharacterized protein n=1 Tax=Canariomyces notabilis TaxID=2074819 RepID=A0AAN6QCE0_9PEZI|nr:hypothetical protein N656DRAFT_719711 [Canariomyces arenarius]